MPKTPPEPDVQTPKPRAPRRYLRAGLNADTGENFTIIDNRDGRDRITRIDVDTNGTVTVTEPQ